VTPERLSELSEAVDDALIAEGATVDEVSALVVSLIVRVTRSLCEDDPAGQLQFIKDVAASARSALSVARNYGTDHEIH
jgi:hypothetical protein